MGGSGGRLLGWARRRGRGLGAALAVLGAVLAWGSGPAAADRVVLDGLASVQDDGTLRLEGQTVRLYGLFLPTDGRTCRFYIQPGYCNAKSVIVLNDLVDGFVRCEIVSRDPNGVLAGVCTKAGRDLFGPRIDIGAVLVNDGWALAGPDAPYQYVALERLARSREVGLWGAKIQNFR